jgi:L-asparaginase
MSQGQRVEKMQNEKRKLTLLTTGGTIEKSYDEEHGVLENRETFLRDKIQKKLRLPYTELMVKNLMNKDSLFMDDQDRETILLAIKEHEKNQAPIVIIHGTDTMQVSAKFCFDKHQPKVPVIFTGAMKPMGFDDSDAIQNVNEALMSAFLVPAGFYISFHGKIFKVPHVQKNKSKLTFEEC